MEREEKQQSSRGSAVGVGMVCGFIGAVIGAVGYHFLKKEEEMQQQHYSRSEPRKVYTDGTCPICLSKMKELTVLPCGHQYHASCMKQLRESDKNPKCPMCRKECNE